MKTIKNPFTVFAKVLAIPVLALLLSPLSSYADDTATLQAQLNAGAVTLPAGHAAYNVSGMLTVAHAFNMNGNTIISTVTSGAAVLLNSGGSISNGTIQGTWVYTTAANAAGVYGVKMNADNTSLTSVHVTMFPGYGVKCGPNNGLSVTKCTIDKIGYIGFYFDAEVATTTGGTFSNNTVDRSMLPPSTVTQGDVQIRASTSVATDVTTGWTIANNVMKMPSMPTDYSSECMEIRYMANSTVSGNTFTAGSIGCSVVGGNNITVTGNTFSGSSNEAIEFANSKNSTSTGNIVNSSLGVAVLLDGNLGNTNINLTNDKYSNTASDCVHAVALTSGVNITGCTFAVTAGNRGMNLKGTTGVTITNSTFNGLNSSTGKAGATQVVYMDTCPGNVTINGGTIANFTTCVVAIYSAQAGLVTNNVKVAGVTITNVPKGMTTLVSNGATVGTTNIEAVTPSN